MGLDVEAAHSGTGSQALCTDHTPDTLHRTRSITSTGNMESCVTRLTLDFRDRHDEQATAARWRLGSVRWVTNGFPKLISSLARGCWPPRLPRPGSWNGEEDMLGWDSGDFSTSYTEGGPEVELQLHNPPGLILLPPVHKPRGRPAQVYPAMPIGSVWSGAI